MTKEQKNELFHQLNMLETLIFHFKKKPQNFYWPTLTKTIVMRYLKENIYIRKENIHMDNLERLVEIMKLKGISLETATDIIENLLENDIDGIVENLKDYVSTEKIEKIKQDL